MQQTTQQVVVRTVNAVGDTASIGTVIATFAGWLPSMAALFTILWTSIRIWETKTVQRWLGRADKACDKADVCPIRGLD